MEDQERLLDYLRRVTTSLRETRQRLADAEAGRHEPIAIVSTACRFPGGIRSPEDLWEVVAGKRDVVTEAPAERGWDLVGDGSATTQGGFVDDAMRFDAAFFGISPREALGMDPQQRLLLEVAWETVERARMDPTSLRGSRTGVFTGLIDEGYEIRLREGTADVDGYVLTGCTTSVASGRIAYVLGLEGPAVTVDTACSSSLVALHLACQSLRLGECDRALAGGALVMSTTSTFVEFSRQGALSADGRCRAFGAEASGFGLSEGVGLVLLERLSDALRDGHPVLAVIRGSAVNSDGASNGLTAPNGQSQQRVIRAALRNAGLAADEVDLIEAHGTGTRLGDPIEGRALLETYGADPARRVWLGSVKSNIGHTQATAGVAGVIKMVEALRHRRLPPTLHADPPSPLLDWDLGGLALITDLAEWPDPGRPRRAAVSAFGISGTNAHLILEAAPEPEQPPQRPEPPSVAAGLVCWPVSGADDAGLREQATRLLGHLEPRPDMSAVDVGYTLAAARATLPHRAVVLGADRAELLSGLRAVARGRVARTAVRAAAPAVEPGRTVFVFPGQGSQWVGMARELMDGSDVFRSRLESCAGALAPYVDWPVLAVLRGDVEAPLERPDVVQPALFAMMVSLAEVWRAYGVEPAAVVGHSQGEIAAACVAGALELDEAARVVCLRSRVVLELSGTGGLVSLALSEDQARTRLTRWGDALEIAVVNSPRAVVVAGPAEALEELTAACEADGIRARRVRADYASHSARVETVRERLREVLGDVRAGRGEVPVYSTVTGDVVDGRAMDGEYWYQNLRGTVRFEAATRRLLADGHHTFVEVSPHPLLITGIEETAEAVGDGGVVATGTLRRDDGGPDRMSRSVADAFVRGAEIDWARPLAAAGGRLVDLCATAFRGPRYWPEPARYGGPGGTGDGGAAGLWAAVDAGDLARVTGILGVGPQAGTAELVAALADWRRHADTAAAVAGWRYRVGWSPMDDADSAPVTGTWLVVARSRTAPVDAVLAMLDEHGASARLVAPDDIPTGEPVAGVLSMLALDTRGELDRVAELVALLRALDGVDAPLWCATQGAVSTGRSDPLTRPEQAAVWGLGRVAALEHPGRWGGLVDLPDVLDSRVGARLARVLAGTGEDQVALRGSAAFARRLRPAPAQPVAPDAWLPPSPVLITGGTGALGGHLARHLARAGVEHLVLASRRGPDAPGAAELAEELGASGARVSVSACDLADRDDVAALLAGIGAPVRTVVHAAGVPALTSLADATPAELADAFGAKVSGAHHLHELLGDAVSAFVVFSSGSGVWGAGGQGPYAAANAALDALVEQRRAQGMPGTAVAWGLWQADGMAAGATGAGIRSRGLTPMAPQRAVAALCDAVARDEGSVVVADIRWEQFVTAFTSARPSRLFDDIPQVRALTAAPATTPATAGGTRLAASLRELTPARRRELLLELVTTHAAAVLNLSGKEAVATGRAFRELGFDSLTSVELRNRLVAETGLALATTVVFDHPTPEALAAHLRAELAGDGVAEPARRPVAVPADEPVAIIGMSCRFPGGADDPDALWRLVADRVDAMGPFPQDRGWNARWDLDTLLDPGQRYGGFRYDAADFDADFFGLSPREATAMDPQQRLVLETAWEAVERAGINPHSLRDSRTAVVTGIVSQDYTDLLRDAPDVEGYRITGGSAAVVSGRVAYLLGLAGPALTVDTACSSSLVAIHLACQALRRGEATLALAGGATVMASPTPFLEFAKQQGLSSDGRCHAFAASADGTGWGEGAGMVLLERLSDAREHGHNVLAVIRGSAVNSDGASNGMTAPSGPAQQDVIRQALADAGLAATDVDAVEAHGTATTLGDPIEARSVIAAYGQHRDRPIWLGSLKSNVGHTQAAAGVGGVIKMVQALRNELLPATLHVDTPTPHVDWSTGAVRLLTEPVSWPRGDRPRRAGVSAFGISGTNAHLILEEGPAPQPVVRAAQPRWLPLVLSGRGRQAPAAQAGRLLRHLDANPHLALADVAHALVTTRAHQPDRAVVLSIDGDRGPLAALAAGARAAEVCIGTARERPGIALLLPGQGSQSVGLGRALAAAFPSFAAAFDAVCAHVDQHLDRPLATVLHAEPGSADAALLDQTGYAQVALFAVEVALARLLAKFGVRPDALLGHSIGELAAVHLAGALSLSDACALVTERGRLMQAQPAGGAMVAVEASAGEVLPTMAGREGRIALAAVNGPRAVVLSGDEQAVLEAAAEWSALGRRTKRLRVSHAFHSPHMAGAQAALGRVAARLTWAPAEVPVVSNLTGVPATDEQLRAPDYWARHLREPVRFDDGVRWLAGNGITVAVELGGAGALTTQVRQNLEQEHAGPLADRLTVLPVLRTPRPEVEAFLRALAELYVHGVAVDWAAVLAELGHRPGPTPEPLPTTVFHRRRHWLAAPGTDARRGTGKLDHPVLDHGLALADGGWVFTGRLSRHGHPWLADHAVDGTPVVPGIALAELVLSAGGQVDCPRIDDLTFPAAVTLPDEEAVEVQVRIGPPARGERPVTVHSRRDGTAWVCNATGRLTRPEPDPDSDAAPPTWPPTGAVPVPADQLYRDLADRGYTFGPAFRGVRAAWRRGEEWFTEVELPERYRSDARRFRLHPALLDSAGHPLLLSSGGRGEAGGGAVPVLFAVAGVQVDTPGVTSLRARLVAHSPDTVELVLADGAGAPVARVERLTVRAIATEVLRGTPSDALFRLRWSPATVTGSAGAVAVLGETHADLAAVAASTVPPDTVIARVDGTGGRDRAAAVRQAAHNALRLANDFLDEPRLARSVLVFVTAGGVSVDAGDRPAEPSAAAVWGLVRTAQSEHPDRFVLADVDADPASWHAVAAAARGGQPQLALRAGAVWTPRLRPERPSPPARRLDPAGTVLVTGAGGALARQVARHLVLRHGARHLLLVSRRQPDDLAAELTGLGATVEVVRCDVGDRARLAEVVAAVAPDRPLTAVVHAAGVVDDAMVTELTGEQIDRVLGPKVDGALHLLELTRGAPLIDFVLFSSAAGVLGNPGQAGYAAANAALDAIAEGARADGVPVRSLAWGPWVEAGGMAGRIDDAAAARLRRIGVVGLDTDEALALFDVAGAVTSVPVRLDLAAVRHAASAPSLLRDLVPVADRTPAATTVPQPAATLGDTVRRLDDEERDRALLAVVCTHVARVLGHARADDIDPRQPFLDLGFTSLTAVELRNELGAQVGLRLPATLVFEFPTPVQLARHLAAQLATEASRPTEDKPRPLLFLEPIS